MLDWLLSFALRLEYEDNGKLSSAGDGKANCFVMLKAFLAFLFPRKADAYGQKAAEFSKSVAGGAPEVIQANPLDNLDFESDEFKQGVAQLAEHLKVPLHPNHLVTLEAISKLIQAKYSADERAKQSEKAPAKVAKNAPMTISDVILGFETGDKVLDKAVKVLRLLYINDAKELQTEINRVIVDVQTVTANPKTDTALGQIGRG